MSRPSNLWIPHKPNRRVCPIRALLLALAAALLVSGCATTPPLPDPVPLQLATQEIAPDELIHIVVAPLDPGVAADPDDRDEDVFEGVRKAEARFIGTQIKQTLENSGQWGSVGVGPATNDIGLAIEGRILDSTGEDLAIALEARDATGRVWLDQTYRSRVPVSAYGAPAGEQREPFEHLYHRIANDLVAARDRLSRRDRIEIGQVAELRFAETVAPDAFAGRLETDREGRTRVLRLPAEDDVLLGHVRAVRDRDLALRETLDEGYADFHADLKEPYARWRSFSAEERNALRKVERQAYMKAGLGVVAIAGGIVLAVLGADPTSATGQAADILAAPLILGGLYGTVQGAQQLAEREIHVGTLEELGNSFEADVEPRVVEIQGETVRITGNAEAQYTEWRRLLRAIYQAETGLPVSETEVGAAAE